MYLKKGYRLHTGKYQLLNIIGEGGFSLTYKGLWNTEIRGALGKITTQAPVCIKEYFFKDYCLRDEKTHFVQANSTNGNLIFNKYKEKIIKEARILSEIHHPNVVKVLEVFKQNNTVYIVMEFISGDSLKKKLEQTGIFKEEQLLPIIYKIGHALQYIHEKNILHLDIKPSNILMDKNNNPKLIDFGISKRYDLQDQQETSTTILAASKGYASIEQYDSEGMQLFSPCPDIYSLGATMYFLLTGEAPTESILRSTKGLPSPREVNPEISENTENVILKAMSLHAADRYQSVIEMITDLGYNPETDQVQLTSVPGKDDDQTELLPVVKQSMDQPFDVDDETQIYLEEEERKKEKKRKKKQRIIYSLIAVAAMIAGFTFLLLNGYINSGNNNPPVSENDLNKTDSLSISIQPLDNDTASISLTEGSSPQQKIDISPNSDTNTEVQSDSNQKQYEQFTNSGMKALENKDFEHALIDFKNAEQYAKSVEEKKDVENYIDQCRTEFEKLEIEKRKKQYEIKMKFGTFEVVKSESGYGAIDNKGIEKIPCIYETSEAVGIDSRAFLRSDGLWDVYSSSGEKTKERVKNY